MEPTDLTIEILEGIREETHKTNERLDETNDRLDSLTTEMRTGLKDLGNRQTATELRLATELAGVAGAVREVRDLLREDRVLRNRVDDHERRISAMERGPG